MEDNLTSISNQVIELPCSQCKGYLSCGPVRLLPDGTWICGQCTPPNSDVVVYRELLLEETVLKNAVFPCRFKTNGCRYNVAFGQAMEHESKCVYQPYHCPLPASNDETCCWSGLQSELIDHLTENHPSCLLEAGSFIIQVDQNCQGIFAVLKDDLVFLVKYLYLTSTRSLNYDVRYINIDEAVSASYKINIENHEIPDCNFSLKNNPCPIIGTCFNKLNNILNLNKYMEALDNPNSIKINIILKHVKKEKPVLETIKNLASLLCLKCNKEYLVFPIFRMDSQTVCFKCAYNNYCSPSESSDSNLKKRIVKTNFPCRWQTCNFIGTGDVIRTHEINCKLRDSHCPICLTLITTTSAAIHLQKCHPQNGCKDAITLHLIPHLVYYVDMVDNSYIKYAFLIENNKVIIVKHDRIENIIKQDTLDGKTINLKRYYFSAELLLGTFEDEKVIVQFEYKDCKRKSVEFILSKATPKINYKDFLSCEGSHTDVSVKLRSCK